VGDSKEEMNTMIFVPPGQPKSMLGDLTAEEQTSLSAWSIQQEGDPERGGVVDLGAWPGWEAVLARRFKERFGVDMPPATGTSK